MAVEIPLTRGYVMLIDEEDAEWVSARKWQAYPAPHTTYVTGNVHGKRVHLHRLLLNAPDGLEVDHINRNGLDNRRCNLRLATHAQNEANKPPRGQYKGAYWCERTGRWRALIRVDGHLKHLGRFDSVAEAARAYDVAALEAFGEFAYLNFRIEP